jgi:hypothetical protein
MNPAEIVVHVVTRDCCRMVRNLLAVSVHRSRKSAHTHAHRKVLSFYEEGPFVLVRDAFLHALHHSHWDRNGSGGAMPR